MDSKHVHTATLQKTRNCDGAQTTRKSSAPQQQNKTKGNTHTATQKPRSKEKANKGNTKGRNNKDERTESHEWHRKTRMPTGVAQPRTARQAEKPQGGRKTKKAVSVDRSCIRVPNPWKG